MRIALFCDGLYPYVVGGMQKHSYELARALGALGVRVDLYAALPAGQMVEAWRRPLYDALSPNVTPRFVARPEMPYFPTHYLLSSKIIAQRLLEAYEAAEKADFLYVQGFTGWAALHKKERGADLPPIGVNLHGLEMYQRPASQRSWMEQRLLRPYVRKHMLQADAALCLGGGLNDILQEIGVPARRIVESPNGVGKEWLSEGPTEAGQKRRLVFVGRYERRKGIEELQEALERLAHQEGRFEMHFVGPIPEQLQVKAPHVRYWGMVRQPEALRGILRSADVLVCPSHSEGMPTVILEAMASGLAVLATRVGAVDAMVDGTCGWLLEPGDSDELTAALNDALTCSDETLQSKKNAAVARVEKFLWPRVAETTLANVQEWLARQEGSGLPTMTGTWIHSGS